MTSIKTTNRLLLILVLPVVFYMLHILSFIFIPLLSSMFIALLFLPLMRWLKSKGANQTLSVATVILVIAILVYAAFLLLNLSSQEILATKDVFMEKAKLKIASGIEAGEKYFGMELTSENNKKSLFQQDFAMQYAGTAFKFAGSFVTQVLMTLFFVVLWLAESINFEKMMNSTLLKVKFSSVKTFRRIEKDIIKFLRVKFLVSFGTGVGTCIACYCFDVSFPIFWGIFAFSINFIQMVGSFITVILCSLFAYVELDPSITLMFFIISVTLVQVLFCSILEPIYMGKSFSINIISVLIMLMFWGFIWGVPGMIMSIPITVFLKIILEQFEPTKVVARLLS
jgi:AI-2 transport protein TqsA